MLWVVLRLTLPLIFLSTALMTLAAGLSSTLQPDAPQIAYESYLNYNSDIFLLDLNSHLTHNLTRHPAPDTQPAWSAANGKIAFVSVRHNGSLSAIYEMDQYGRGVRALQFGDLDYWHPAWSPDGHELVAMKGFKDIYIIDPNTRRERQVAIGFSPVWSPVDDRITYYSDHPNDLNADIYIVDSDGRNIRNITQSRSNDWGAALSPDGTQIAFASSYAGKVDIFVMDVGCICLDRARQLTKATGENSLPAWSPDGSRIAFVSKRDGSEQVYIMNADGSNQRRVTFSGERNRAPVWKP